VKWKWNLDELGWPWDGAGIELGSS
jgi:hypothetical protein